CEITLTIVQVLIYAFLSEKVYIVWTGGNQTSRIEAKVYRVCAFVLLGYVAVGILTVLGRDSTVRHESGVCVIGLKAFACVPLILYDMSLNIFLTAMFLWPLWKSHPMSPRLRSIAKRTLYGASTSLISSMINIAILFLLGGNELGWICISSCVADVGFSFSTIGSNCASATEKIISGHYQLTRAFLVSAQRDDPNIL
ncbi:hypothetical protein F5880DRAFT_1470418, partial [Lentinula raphanica]